MVRKILPGLFAGIVAVSFALHVFAAPIDNWTKRNDGTDYELFAAAYGNNTFVVVGDSGTILSSPDGVEWTPRTVELTSISGQQIRLLDVIYQKGLFVAVGTAGIICTSPDGVTWTPRKSGMERDLSGVAYGNNVFVAVGQDELMWMPGIMISPVITTSPDGITWTVQPTDIPYGLNDVAFGNGIFLAVGYDPTMMGNNARCVISINGIDWCERNTGTDFPLNGVGFGNGLFVVVAEDGSIFTSPFGESWDMYTDPQSRRLSKVAFGREIFVAVGGNSGFEPYAAMLTSPDGEEWTDRLNDATAGETQLHGIGFVNNTFMAVGGDSSGTIFQSDPISDSDDGGTLPVGPAAAGISALLVWWKRRKHRAD